MIQTDSRADADIAVRNHFDRMTRAYLRSILSDEVIAEHRTADDKHLSEPLARLLHWMHRRRMAEPYAIMAGADGGFRLIAMSPRRGTAPRPLDERSYASLGEARHALFVLHLRDLEE
jgi:hypothetical protein